MMDSSSTSAQDADTRVRVNTVTNCRRRRRRLLCLYISVCSFTTLIVADAFQQQQNYHYRNQQQHRLYAQNPQQHHHQHHHQHCSQRSYASPLHTSSWARKAAPASQISTNAPTTAMYATKDTRGTSARRSSPLQVRRRVRAVLERARSRTGIENTSSATVVAEAATLGGLGDGTDDFVIGMKPQPTSNGRTLEQTMNIQFPDERLEWTKSANGQKNGAVANGATANGKLNGSSQAINGGATNGASANANINGSKSSSNVDGSRPRVNGSAELDAIKADTPAAAQFCEPPPFKLPKLTKDQILKLQRGERVQEQSRMGREGSGFVVLDVQAPPYVVWECLLDFESYPETIPTVRDMQLFTNKKLNTGYVNEKPVLPGTGRETRHYGTPSVTRAAFVLSKFRLNIAAIHTYTPHPDGDYMEFTLDPSCTNMVLKGAKGTWYTEEAPEGREGFTRVYLLCEVQISRALPSFIVDYAADRAMPRATSWLRPQVEAAADLWLKPKVNGDN